MAIFLKRIVLPLLITFFLSGCLTINHLNIIAEHPDTAGTTGVAIIDTARLGDDVRHTVPVFGEQADCSATLQAGQPMIVIIGNVTEGDE